MTDLVLHTCPDVAELARRFVASVAVPGDPFARPLLLVPGSGMQRWLSQQVARRSASDGEGISAGLDTHRVSSLERLLDPGSAHDPWLPERLVWSVLDAAESDSPELAPLVGHLDANDQRYANALRIARLFRRYADHRPRLLTSWASEGAPTGQPAAELGFDVWQLHLWRALLERVSSPDPVARRETLVSRVRAGAVALPWPVVHVFAPRATTRFQRDALAAISARVAVHVWLPTTGAGGAFETVAAALGGRSEQWLTQWVEVADRVDTLAAGVPSGGPAQVSLHSSHALGRQAEVLREVLTAAFADDSSLEPRDVAVLTPDPAGIAPHLAALFTPPVAAGGVQRWAHPGTQLRVQATEGAEGNQLYALLSDLLQLGATRASASQLLELAAHPFVARRFGFGGDALDRLEKLVDAAAIRWGINPEHRAAFGLAGVQQNTWQLGVQRLVLGEAFSDDDLASVGVVATVDDVTSTDTDLVGALAELVSRTSRLVRLFATDGTAVEWAGRLRDAVELMADVPFTESWQESQLWAVLEEVRSRGEASEARLRAADALALLTDAFADRGIRPAFGNGSLVVTSLDALARVPHRMICLVGLDERTFPRRGLGDGDDLLLRAPEPSDPDPGSDDRQALLDAVLSAGERLAVVFQGQSSLTPEPHYPPAPLADLIEAVQQAGGSVRTETLQPFAPAAFAALAGAESFDAGALRAARALVGPRRAAPGRHEVGFIPRTEPLTAIAIDRLEAMIKHPGDFFLRERAGLTFGNDDPPTASIPVEVGHLTRWQLGQTMLEGLAAGRTPDEVVNAAWLSGELPPRRLGAEAIGEIAERAGAVHTRLLREAGAEPEASEIDLDIDGVRITGRLVTRGGLLAEAQFGNVDARHLGPAWVRLLALTVALERRADVVLVGGKGPRRLVGPPVDVARGFLSDLVHLAGHATEQVLPLPPRVAEFWARERANGRDPKASAEQLNRIWGWEANAWKLWWNRETPPWQHRRAAGDPWGEPGEDTVLGALAVRVFGPIVRAQSASGGGAKRPAGNPASQVPQPMGADR